MAQTSRMHQQRRRNASLWQRLLREPTLHFAALGAALFALYPLLAPSTITSTNDPAHDVVIPASRIASVVDGWTEGWGRPPTQGELAGLIEDEVRSEILAREAIALGLQHDDDVVRSMLREKMEMLAENGSAMPKPTEVELRAFYAANPGRFGGGPNVSFVQVRLDPTRRGADLARDAAVLLSQLRAGGGSVDISSLGDPSPPGNEFQALSEEGLVSLFGRKFAQALLELEPGRWAGPIPSPYGQHLVLVTERTEREVAPFDQVRDRVREEWRAARQNEIRDRAYRAVRARYKVSVEQFQLPNPAAMVLAPSGASRP